MGGWKKSLEFEPGTEFELLTVIEKLENKNGRSNYLCQCSCGNICEALGKALNNTKKGKPGSKKSCGCLISMISRTHCVSDEKDLVGEKIGRLLVIESDF